MNLGSWIEVLITVFYLQVAGYLVIELIDLKFVRANSVRGIFLSLMQILLPQIEPLTEQQTMSICTLQQTSHAAEENLSSAMESLQQTLADTLSAGSFGSSSNVANYMTQMAVAMSELAALETFVLEVCLVAKLGAGSFFCTVLCTLTVGILCFTRTSSRACF